MVDATSYCDPITLRGQRVGVGERGGGGGVANNEYKDKQTQKSHPEKRLAMCSEPSFDTARKAN